MNYFTRFDVSQESDHGKRNILKIKTYYKTPHLNRLHVMYSRLPIATPIYLV